MSDYEDYDYNLAFAPADAKPDYYELDLDELVMALHKRDQQIKEANKIIISFDRLVAKITGSVFQNVLDYYKKYGVDRRGKQCKRNISGNGYLLWRE